MAVPAGRFDAVVFDLGGVVMPSPIDVFRDYESRMGLPHRFLSEVVLAGGDDGAWSRLERGELTMDEFGDEFAAECARAGGSVDVAELFDAVHAGAGARPEMVAAITRIRARGIKTGALTNNWRADEAPGAAPAGRTALDDLFDVVVESAVEGIRKPDPRIYELVCDRLAIEPRTAVYLDDLGVNLKPARAMGMITIKVVEPADALAELEGVLGFPLTDPVAH